MPKRISITIVFAQFFCTSLWFAGNAIMSDLAKQFDLGQEFLAYLTNAVQFGFITGTLLFAILAIADRFAPSRVFFCCAVIAAFFNFAVVLSTGPREVILFRFLTGFFIAGIYPVGMKIASDYTAQGLGKSLGFLVGALVLGTSFPHLLKSINSFSWTAVVYITSILAAAGGLLLLILVPNGPYRKKAQYFKFNSFFTSFKNKEFRAVAFGYFGHQWELYTFWVFLPFLLDHFQQEHPTVNLNVSLVSFAIIALGAIACMVSGVASQRFGVRRIAQISLGISGFCCLISPLILAYGNVFILFVFLSVWSFFVVADSPLFSTLVAQYAIPELKGTSMTIVISIGFAITMASIQVVSIMSTKVDPHLIYLILAIGPALGLLAMYSKNNSRELLKN